MEIEESDLVAAVKEAKRALEEKGSLINRRVGHWCLQNEETTTIKEIRNILITVNDPRQIWYERISRGLLVDTFDILLGMNPGHVHEVWNFYDKWRTKNGEYPYSYGQRIFSGQVDQWNECVKMLLRESTSRQANVVFRRPEDLLVDYTPCSISMQFYVDEHKQLSATYMMRSNDIAIGGLPRNIFIGCQLLMQMALATKLSLGKYHHFDVNLHHYTNQPKDLVELDELNLEVNPEGDPPLLDNKEKSLIRKFLKAFFERGELGSLDNYKDIKPYWKDWLNRIAGRRLF